MPQQTRPRLGGLSGLIRLSFSRGAVTRHRTGPGRHVPLQLVAVQDDKAVPVPVQDVGQLVDVRGALGLQRRRQHLSNDDPAASADDFSDPS